MERGRIKCFMKIHTKEKLIQDIIEQTEKGNIDNISRTVFYKKFYRRNPEVRWALLASMVSRNAGWNMTDLETEVYRQLLNDKLRRILFLTYERANWLIFSDAYPQLLLYEASKKFRQPLFHLCHNFGVSTFMVKEWEWFWEEKDVDRLVTSQIINEQSIIQGPVINHPFYKKKVFYSLSFQLQEWFHFSTVLFPSLDGKLYGLSVHGFRELKNRIFLGRKLYMLLFQTNVSNQIHQFSDRVIHTGSRNDYEEYRKDKIRQTAKLRDIFPIIKHHRRKLDDWYRVDENYEKYYDEISLPKKIELTKWFAKKQHELSLLATIQQKLSK
jgi:hypothetical protein